MNIVLKLLIKTSVVSVAIFLMFFLQSKRVLAVPEDADLQCPTGGKAKVTVDGNTFERQVSFVHMSSNLAANFCCESGSTWESRYGVHGCFKGALDNVNNYSRFNFGIQDREVSNSLRYCKAGQTLSGAGPGGGTAKCTSKYDIIPGGPFAGKYFLGCNPQKPLVRNGWFGSFPTANIQLNFCEADNNASAKDTVIYADSTKVCVCKGDVTSTEVPSGSTCLAVCGGNEQDIYYNEFDESGGPGGSFMSVCSGTDCCTSLNNGVSVEDAQERLSCFECVSGGRIFTALGCIDATTNGLVVWLIRFAIGLIIAISIFRFIQASTLLQKADPESVQEGREVITSAIVALVLALISVPLLQFVGVNILGIFPAGFI